MIGSSAKSNDQSQDHHTNNDNDLETGQPEFEFTEETDSKVVDGDNDDEEYGDPYSWIDLVARQPVLNDQSGGGKLVGRDNDILEPVTVGRSSISQGSLSHAFLSLCLSCSLSFSLPRFLCVPRMSLFRKFAELITRKGLVLLGG